MKMLLALTALLLSITAGTARADTAGNKSAAIFAGLPLDMAIKQVRGNGKRLFATFEDPNCVYCRRLAIDVSGMTDVTIYIFLYPILSWDSKEKAKAIWCSADREKAWTRWIVDGVAPVATNCDVGAIDKIVALGKKLKIHGTPTIFLANGERLFGAVPVMALEMAISSPKVLAFQAALENGQSSDADLPARARPPASVTVRP